MTSNFDWISVLLQCRENVLAHVHPLLGRLKEPQPDLRKGAGGDQMKLVDLAAEKAIVEVLLERRISFTLISEESGIRKYGDQADNCFITADPIDGTTNLTRGLPFYATSIAVSRKPVMSEVYAGLVADLHHGSTYTAVEGEGARRNGVRIKTSAVTSLEEAVIGLDLNTYKIREIIDKVSELIQHTRHIRHFGANALELCYVAEGLTDAFVDIRGKLRMTDVAAGFLILKEAGGIITTPEGRSVNVELDPKQKIKFVASGNALIHQAILSLVGSREL